MIYHSYMLVYQKTMETMEKSMETTYLPYSFHRFFDVSIVCKTASVTIAPPRNGRGAALGVAGDVVDPHRQAQLVLS